MSPILASKRSQERTQERAIHLQEFASFKISSIKKKDHEQCGEFIKQLGTNLWYHIVHKTIHVDKDGFPSERPIQ